VLEKWRNAASPFLNILHLLAAEKVGQHSFEAKAAFCETLHN
jgi:hypothetical protein